LSTLQECKRRTELIVIGKHHVAGKVALRKALHTAGPLADMLLGVDLKLGCFSLLIEHGHHELVERRVACLDGHIFFSTEGAAQAANHGRYPRLGLCSGSGVARPRSRRDASNCEKQQHREGRHNDGPCSTGSGSGHNKCRADCTDQKCPHWGLLVVCRCAHDCGVLRDVAWAFGALDALHTANTVRSADNSRHMARGPRPTSATDRYKLSDLQRGSSIKSA
jgi:hypothetical protein